MLSKGITVILSLVAAASGTPLAVRRDEGTRLYAYGKGIPGFEVYAGADGTAYIAASPGTNLTELTWSSPSRNSTWDVSANSTGQDVPAHASKVFYIVNSEAAYEPCGFRSPNETVPAGASTTGFFLFGKQAFWSDGSAFEAQFWARAAGAADLFTLNWNQAGVQQSDSVPVTLKTAAPAVLSRARRSY